MKKLADNEKLTRGVQILLTAQDKNDLEKMALETGVSLAAIARPHVLRALERWRAKNPEAAISPAPQPRQRLSVGGKTVRSPRIAEMYKEKTHTPASLAGRAAATRAASKQASQVRPAATRAGATRKAGTAKLTRKRTTK